MELDRSGEVDWSLVTGDDPWIPYEWASGRVFPLPPSVGNSKSRHGSEGSQLDPVGALSGVTAVPWRSDVEQSCLPRCFHSVRCFQSDIGLDTETPTLTNSDTRDLATPASVDTGTNEEARQFRINVRAFEAEKETSTSNFDNFSTETDRLQANNATLKERVTGLTERVTELKSEMAQVKTDLNVRNSHVVALEVAKTTNNESVRFERLRVRNLQTQDDLWEREMK